MGISDGTGRGRRDSEFARVGLGFVILLPLLLDNAALRERRSLSSEPRRSAKLVGVENSDPSRCGGDWKFFIVDVLLLPKASAGNSYNCLCVLCFMAASVRFDAEAAFVVKDGLRLVRSEVYLYDFFFCFGGLEGADWPDE